MSILTQKFDKIVIAYKNGMEQAIQEYINTLKSIENSFIKEVQQLAQDTDKKEINNLDTEIDAL